VLQQLHTTDIASMVVVANVDTTSSFDSVSVTVTATAIDTWSGDATAERPIGDVDTGRTLYIVHDVHCHLFWGTEHAQHCDDNFGFFMVQVPQVHCSNASFSSLEIIAASKGQARAFTLPSTTRVVIQPAKHS
jgi:hypothetical protein